MYWTRLVYILPIQISTMSNVTRSRTISLLFSATLMLGCSSSQPTVQSKKICSTVVDVDRTGVALINNWTFKGYGSSMSMASCKPGTIKEMSLKFIENGSLQGTSSCNSLSANYSAAGGKLQITGIGVTEKLCGSNEDQIMIWEKQFITGIEGANGYVILGNSLLLKTNSGNDLFFLLNAD